MSKGKHKNISNEEDTYSSEEDESNFDSNTCSDHDLEQQFTQYGIVTEEALSLKKVFALKLSNDKSFNKICTSMSDGSVQILNLNSVLSLQRSFVIKESENVCDTKFIDENHLLVTADNQINLYDLRTNQICTVFQDQDKHPISCFDINCSNKMICAGTNQIQKDVFLLFFDLRQQKTLGGYWESHQDDITSVKFHPIKENEMLSGSTDGLLNIFDLSKETEEDALLTTINTESSIEKLNWHHTSTDDLLISCITHTNDFQLFNYDGDQINNFERSIITKSLKRQSVGDCNLINCHSFNDDNSIFLLAGSNYKKGEILRSVKLENNNTTLQPLNNFAENKQIVRDSLYNSQNNMLISCGEAGIVTIWSPKSEISTSSVTNRHSAKIKTKTNKKGNKSNPY